MLLRVLFRWYALCVIFVFRCTTVVICCLMCVRYVSCVYMVFAVCCVLFACCGLLCGCCVLCIVCNAFAIWCVVCDVYCVCSPVRVVCYVVCDRLYLWFLSWMSYIYVLLCVV